MARVKEDRMPPESEASLLAKVTRAAKAYGWRVYHPWRSDHSEKGWPDLVLCKPPRLFVVELKDDKREPTQEQLWWIDALQRCDVDAELWRPRDWDYIEATLAGKDGRD